jgi:AcrR family transcriptional regulator
MQKKTDRRVRKTKTQLRNGLAMLMKEKSVGEITVKELVDQVDINRSTFYLHFGKIRKHCFYYFRSGLGSSRIIQIYQGCCMRLRMIWQRRWNVQSESIQLKSERIMDFIFFRTYFKC